MSFFKDRANTTVSFHEGNIQMPPEHMNRAYSPVNRGGMKDDGRGQTMDEINARRQLTDMRVSVTLVYRGLERQTRF